jgi:hypothetical protein
VPPAHRVGYGGFFATFSFIRLQDIRASLRAELTEEMNHSLALVREGHVQQMLKVQQDMASLQADIAALNEQKGKLLAQAAALGVSDEAALLADD